jgi:DnaJ-class molecular chaperone
MNKRDYYEILGIAKTASEDEIKKAWRTTAVRYHPDKHVGKSESEVKIAEEKFKEAKEAYEYLSDPDKKRQYDQFGHVDPSQQHRTGPQTWTFHTNNAQDMNDILGDLFRQHPQFGDLFGRRQRQQIQVITISLADAYKGGSVPIPGTGKTVSYPKGTRSGATFYVDDKLYRLDVQPDAKFKRSNDDLLVDVEITAVEAMLGVDAILEHLDSSKLQFAIRPGIQSGQVIRLGGKGMKNPEIERMGDLLIRITVTVPTTLSDKEKEALKTLGHRSNINI